MKKLFLTLSLVSVLGTTSMFAAVNTNLGNLGNVINEITTMLSNNDLIIENNDDVMVTITVNSDNEIAVLDVDSKNETIKSFVKTSLNNKKIQTFTLEKGKEYTFKLKIRKEK